MLSADVVNFANHCSHQPAEFCSRTQALIHRVPFQKNNLISSKPTTRSNAGFGHRDITSSEVFTSKLSRNCSKKLRVWIGLVELASPFVLLIRYRPCSSIVSFTDRNNT